MKSMVWPVAYVEKNVECALLSDIANIPDLEPILSVAGRERTARFGKPQRVSAIIWETFRVHILRGTHVVTSNVYVKSEMDHLVDSEERRRSRGDASGKRQRSLERAKGSAVPTLLKYATPMR